jgi:hypothetical protein
MGTPTTGAAQTSDRKSTALTAESARIIEMILTF